MLRHLIIAGATLAALTGPTLAASGWNVLKEVALPVDQNAHRCIVAERAAGPSEEKLAGPFTSEVEAQSALAGFPECQAGNYN